MRMYQLAYELVHTDDYFHSINKNGSNMKEILQVAKQDISLVQKAGYVNETAPCLSADSCDRNAYG